MLFLCLLFLDYFTGHIPPMTHPWKMASYQAYLLSNKRTEDYAYN